MQRRGVRGFSMPFPFAISIEICLLQNVILFSVLLARWVLWRISRFFTNCIVQEEYVVCKCVSLRVCSVRCVWREVHEPTADYSIATCKSILWICVIKLPSILPGNDWKWQLCCFCQLVRVFWIAISNKSTIYHKVLRSTYIETLQSAGRNCPVVVQASRAIETIYLFRH